MSRLRTVADRARKSIPLHLFSPTPWPAQQPTYEQARPGLIEAALKSATAQPSGNWYVFAPSRDVRAGKPFGATVAGVEIVAWRDTHGVLHAGPRACPHLGADLATARMHEGALLCRWHGLRIDGAPTPRWSPFPAHDDGVLCWVRLDRVGNETPTDTPILPARPADTRVHAVATVTGTCEPDDIIANRLDPWHGSWFHPYSFANLRVTRTPTPDDDRFLLTVTFRVGPRLGVPVEAEFTCPDPRTIVMRILSGEGVGSVVETHATPVDPGPDGLARTTVTEAVIADSTRPGFRAAHHALPLLRPLMRHTALRLWRDDLTYAERRYRQRTRRDARTPQTFTAHYGPSSDPEQDATPPDPLG